MGFDSEYTGEYYSVQKIVSKQIGKNGGVEYLIKWQGYPATKNTWEPEENILSKYLIEEFEKQWAEDEGTMSPDLPEEKQKPKKAKSPDIIPESGEIESHTYNLIPNVKAGWQYNNEPEEILGLKEFIVNGKKQLMFFVKWKGIDVCSFVPTYEANERIPKMVIEFYESRICFTNS
mmetsp:Transcript_16843/g.28659  ORF Transcript_16843/g.28659 Transcript_16843/m.28659 type:complete len:176 (+) Transcript_16843:31-558(+)